jgi:hypothetical protein
MARPIVVDRDGKAHDVDAKSGVKLMEVLRELDYSVAAICGNEQSLSKVAHGECRLTAHHSDRVQRWWHHRLRRLCGKRAVTILQ